VSHRALLLDGTDSAFRQVIYHMALAFNRLLACREFFGSKLRLTGSQFVVLIGTAHQQGERGVTIRELSHHVLMASTHVTTEVGRLMRKGLLRKSPNDEDRRSVLVSLTPRGEEAIASLAPFLRKINDTLFAGVERPEFVSLVRFLARFAASTEAALDFIAHHRRKDR
jgi:DNA-binding MarR family transcriptional regulator